MNRRAIYIIGLIFLCACAEQRIDRNIGDAPRQPWAAQDDIEMLDDSPRFKVNDIELNADEPGILYIIDNDHVNASLRNLETGDCAEFETSRCSITFNNVLLASDAKEIKRDPESGTSWYRGIKSDGVTPVYFVYRELNPSSSL